MAFPIKKLKSPKPSAFAENSSMLKGLGGVKSTFPPIKKKKKSLSFAQALTKA